MSYPDPFAIISPAAARDKFLVHDEQWDERFRPNFGQFIVAPLEYARPVIRLPVPAARTANHALFLVTAGRLELTIGHQAYAAEAGELISVPAMQIFSIEAIRADTTGFMCFFSSELRLSIAGEADFGFLKLTSQPKITVPVTLRDVVNMLFGRLTQEYTESGASRLDLIRPYLLALLAEINRVYADATPTRMDAGDRLVQRFMTLLDGYVRERQSVADYADQLHVSPNHLNKVVRARTGRSPSIWIAERIVLEAKVWLFQSDLTVAQIAAELGFDDPSNFGKLFRKYTHVSPAQFRRMIDINQSRPVTAD